MTEEFHFDSITDLNLRAAFQSITALAMWDRFYKDHVDLQNVNFDQLLTDTFDQAVDSILEELIPVVNGMMSINHAFNPQFSIDDVFEFFNEQDPLEQLKTHQAARRGVRYALRCKHIKWSEENLN
jgi:hypothetical protein